MTADDCRRWRESLGAYVLDHLPAGERAAVEAHLHECPDCRAEAEALGPLAGLMSRADPSFLDAPPTPPAGLADRIADRIAPERRNRRRRRGLIGGLALSGAALAVAIVALVIATGSGDSGGSGQHVSFASLPAGASIEAELEPRPYGTEIHVGVEGLPSGTLCRVYLRRPNGSRVGAGSFRYRSGGDEAVLSSALDLSGASTLVLIAGRWTYSAPLDRGPSAGPATTTTKEDST
jgi:Putative zinc-finger